MHYIIDNPDFEKTTPVCLATHSVDVSNAYDCFQMIWDVSMDYDGMDGSIETMRQLVDELRSYAEQGIKFLEERKAYTEDTEFEDNESYHRAVKMREELGEFSKCSECSYYDKCIYRKEK